MILHAIRRVCRGAAAVLVLLAAMLCAGCVGPLAANVAECRHCLGADGECGIARSAACVDCDVPRPGRLHAVPTRPVFENGYARF